MRVLTKKKEDVYKGGSAGHMYDYELKLLITSKGDLSFKFIDSVGKL